ncbi:MAG TPA: hypothetical protein VEG60_08290 [Candidatus Binatia bacterium]|nr:hypothetical protein [Candidatus Binatia bacterium]
MAPMRSDRLRGEALAAVAGLAAALSLTGASTSAWAHAAERAFVLLLPTGYALAGGTLTVALTFLILVAVPQAPVRRLVRAETTLGAFPYTPGGTLSAVSFLALALLVVAGFLGTRDPLRNPLPLTVWTLWWGGLTVAHALFGNLWAAINPWMAPVRLLRNMLRISNPPFTYPRRLGYWPAALTFLAFAWFELVDPAPDQPTRLALAVVGYSCATIAGMLTFGERAWLARAEAFAVFFRFVALISPIQIDSGRRVRIVLPGAALARQEGLPLSAAVFVLLSLATVSFDGLSKTFWWLALGGINPLEFPGRTAVMMRNSLGLILAWIVLAAAYGLASVIGCRMAGSRLPFKACLGVLVLSILPISIAYHAAHYLPAFLVNAQYALIALGDPFAQGWTLLGTQNRYATVSFLSDYHSVRILWSVQAGTIVLGHLLAVLVAHTIAVERFQPRRSVMASQVPLTLLMVAYTTFGLWLLAAPTAG